MNIFVILVATVTFCALGSISAPLQNDGGETMAMIYLGTADGKSFFEEATPLRTWTEAVEACEATGMKIAQITSSAQATFLENARNGTTFTTRHWQGARDALTLQQLVWDDGLTTPNATILPFLNKITMNGCLDYYSDPKLPTPEWHLHLCTDKMKTLCEISHGKS